MTTDKKKFRQQEIDSIVQRLNTFKSDPAWVDQVYAIDENIIFLNAARSVPSFLKWVFGRMRKIDGKRLLELTDFPVPEWDIKMHERLIELQRRKQPGLIEPLVSAIVDFIVKENRDLVLADLGAGGMEIERQVVTRLTAMNWRKQTIFLGIDKSETTRQVAKNNLDGLLGWADVRLVGEVDQLFVDNVKKTTRKNFTVLLCKNDIFDLSKKFPPKYFDLIYHSLFKHHLKEVRSNFLDTMSYCLSRSYIQYDGLYNKFLLIIQSAVAWSSPVFLNDTVFSMLRYVKKLDLKNQQWTISFFKKTSHYLQII